MDLLALLFLMVLLVAGLIAFFHGTFLLFKESIGLGIVSLFIPGLATITSVLKIFKIDLPKKLTSLFKGN